MFLLFEVLPGPQWVVWHVHAGFQHLERPFSWATVGNVLQHACHFSKKVQCKGLLWQGQAFYRSRVNMGCFSNTVKIEFLCRKVTFGHIGTVQKIKKAKKSARLFFTRYSTLALMGHVQRDAVTPNILWHMYLDFFWQYAALEKYWCSKAQQPKIGLGLFVDKWQKTYLYQSVVGVLAQAFPETMTMFGITECLFQWT